MLSLPRWIILAGGVFLLLAGIVVLVLSIVTTLGILFVIDGIAIGVWGILLLVLSGKPLNSHAYTVTLGLLLIPMLTFVVVTALIVLRIANVLSR